MKGAGGRHWKPALIRAAQTSAQRLFRKDESIDYDTLIAPLQLTNKNAGCKASAGTKRCRLALDYLHTQCRCQLPCSPFILASWAASQHSMLHSVSAQASREALAATRAGTLRIRLAAGWQTSASYGKMLAANPPHLTGCWDGAGLIQDMHLGAVGMQIECWRSPVDRCHLCQCAL